MGKQFDCYVKGTWQLTSTIGYCYATRTRNGLGPLLLLGYLFTTLSFLQTEVCTPVPPPSAAGKGTCDEMVGLSVILENCRDLTEKGSPRPQVLSKGTMIKPPSNPSSPTTPCASPGAFSKGKTPSYSSYSCLFLERCFLCRQKLLPGKDIYMYNGDKAFCSEECRCRQIFMDEEEDSAKTACTGEYNCSRAATSSPSSSASAKGERNRANAFAY